MSSLLLFLVCGIALGNRSVCAADPPVFTNAVRAAGNHLQVQLVTIPGESYTIEISTNLVDWEPVGGFANVETNLLFLEDPEPFTANTRLFYRARVGLTPLLGMFFMHSAQGGDFGSGSTPAVPYPVLLSGYCVMFDAENDEPYPEAATVRFTGPAGSGLINSTAEHIYLNEEGVSYQSPWVSAPRYAPGGEWTIQYKGTDHVFDMAEPSAAQRLVMPVPTVTVAGGMLQAVSWSYRNPETGALLPSRPDYITAIQVQVEGVGGRLFDSDEFEDPAVTSVAVNGVSWANVSSVILAYDDLLDNHYVIFFRKP